MESKMRALVMLILFLGMFLIVQSVYEERVRDLELRLSSAMRDVKETPDLVGVHQGSYDSDFSKVEEVEPYEVSSSSSSPIA